MTHRSNRNRPFERLFCGVLTVCFLCALPALGQEDPVVTSADPSSAEQETYDLDVLVGGDNFGKDSEIHFLVTGTANPGGIHVKKVKQLGPKTLKVTVDVDAGAVVDDFDIEVMSRGRTGKGVELFRVLEKPHPTQDFIPPGAPTNLQVLDVKYGSVLVSFTMPADDGYDPASGPASPCPVSVTPLGGETSNGHWTGDYPWGQPGEEELVLLSHLAPETTYLFSLRCYDDVGGNASEAVEFTETTYPFSAFQDLSWAITEVPVFLDRLIGHRVDPDGKVIIAGFVGTWGGNWKNPLTSSVIRVITGTWDDIAESWTWSFEDVPGFADRLEMGPGGRPAFAGQERLRRETYQVTYTFHDGTEWVREVVGEFETGWMYVGPPGFAFDPLDEPAIAWCAGGRSPGVRLARRDAAGQWSVEAVSSAPCEDRWGAPALAFDEAGNAGIVWVNGEDPYELRFSHQTPQGWAEESVDALPAGDPWWIKPVALAYDPLRADFTAVWWDGGLEVSVCDRAGAAGWGCNVAEPFGSWSESDLALDAAGELFLGLSTGARFDVALTRRLPGQASWTLEEVDHCSTRGFSAEEVGNQIGPFVALDTGHRPTLSWMWGDIDGLDGPSEAVHLYFAWKAQ